MPWGFAFFDMKSQDILYTGGHVYFNLFFPPLSEEWKRTLLWVYQALNSMQFQTHLVLTVSCTEDLNWKQGLLCITWMTHLFSKTYAISGKSVCSIPTKDVYKQVSITPPSPSTLLVRTVANILGHSNKQYLLEVNLGLLVSAHYTWRKERVLT